MASSTDCRLKSAQPSSVPRRATSNLQPAAVEMICAIIVAAGKGARMGPGVDKLFLEVAGRPVVAHTWQRFDNAACIDEVFLVVRDTIKESDGGTRVARTVDRSQLWAVQTPQTFRVEVIRRALAAVRQKGLLVTDDTAACELIGQPVELVGSTAPNPKVTVPGDLP